MKPDLEAIMKGAAKPAADEPDESHMMDLEECGHDVMDALKGGDAKAFAMAMQDFISLCGKEPPDEDAGDEAGASDEG
jgi:hypothetical protein